MSKQDTLRVHFSRGVTYGEIKKSEFLCEAFDLADDESTDNRIVRHYDFRNPFGLNYGSGISYLDSCPNGFISHITFRGMLANNCRRRCGVYRMHRDTTVIHVDNIANPKGETSTQQLEIIAMCITDLRVAYVELREGKLWPDTDYEAEQKNPKAKKVEIS